MLKGVKSLINNEKHNKEKIKIKKLIQNNY